MNIISPSIGWSPIIISSNTTDVGLAVYYKRADANDAGGNTYTFHSNLFESWSAVVSRITQTDALDPIQNISISLGQGGLATFSGIGTNKPQTLIMSLLAHQADVTYEAFPTTPANTSFRYNESRPDLSNLLFTYLLETPTYSGNKTVQTIPATTSRYIAMQLAINPCYTPEITTQPVSNEITYGETATFEVEAIGTGLTYRWQRDNGNGFEDLAESDQWNGEETASLEIIRPGVEWNTYSLRCEVNGSCGNLISSTVTLSVAPKSITILPESNQQKTYGSSDPGNYLFQSQPNLLTGDSYSGSIGRESGENVGTYPYTLNSLSAGDNYELSMSESAPIFTIVKQSLTIQAKDATKGANAPDPAFSSTFSGFVFNETIQTLGGELVYIRAPGINPGTYAITPSGLSSMNYELVYLDGSLTILAAPETVYVDAQWLNQDYFNEIEPNRIYGYNAFSGIQEAINAVATGGTVLVYYGTYSENLLIERQNLNIQGISNLNSDFPVVIGGNNNPTWNIEADGVELSGFEVKHSNLGIGVLAQNSTLLTLENLLCSEVSQAIALIDMSEVDLLSTSVTGASESAVYVQNGSQISLEDNIFQTNQLGVEISGANQGIVLSGNAFLNNLGLSLQSTGGTEIDAESNHWGSIDYADVASEVSGLIDFDPWCNADFTRCGYTETSGIYNETQDRYYISWQAAIDDSDPQDVIRLSGSSVGVYLPPMPEASFLRLELPSVVLISMVMSN